MPSYDADPANWIEDDAAETIDQAQAATLAVALTQATATLYAEQLRASGEEQADPNMYVKETYIEMLDFIREHHGLPRDRSARRRWDND